MGPLERIAIDVVLLPSFNMMDRVIELNKKIALPNEPIFRLNKENCVPHITLSMSCIDEASLCFVRDKLVELSLKYSKIKLSAEGFREQTLPNDVKFIGLKLNDNEILKEIHYELMSSLRDYLFYDSSKDMFVNPGEINDLTIDWVNAWKDKHDETDSYHPHLSIGIGELVDYDFPIEFEVGEIAIFKLGNFCTCREKLFCSYLVGKG